MALKGPDPGAVASFWGKANQSPTRTSCCPRTFRATNQNEMFCSPAFNLPEFPPHRGLLCEWARPAQRRAVPALLFSRVSPRPALPNHISWRVPGAKTQGGHWEHGEAGHGAPEQAGTGRAEPGSQAAGEPGFGWQGCSSAPSALF